MAIFKRKKTKEEESDQDKGWFKPEGELVVDVYETDKEVVVKSAIAGVTIDDFDIFIENDMLEIRGTREKPEEEEGARYLFKECYWGPFSRKVLLPREVDGSKTKAAIKDGILTIKIPKAKKDSRNKVSLAKNKKEQEELVEEEVF